MQGYWYDGGGWWVDGGATKVVVSGTTKVGLVGLQWVVVGGGGVRASPEIVLGLVVLLKPHH